MANTGNLSFDPAGSLTVGDKTYKIYRLSALQEKGIADIGRLPFSLRVLLENLLRSCCQQAATEEDVLALAGWKPGKVPSQSIPFVPARVVMQDFTGVPALVDLAAMRSAMHRAGGDPALINPSVPADLVIDHSVQVDHFGSTEAFRYNVEKEMERNRERYTMLRWGQKAFEDLCVVPPGTGIVHQVNLEYLGKVVQSSRINGELAAFPDTLVGTDSHTPMINGLGILGWGVGGIEAEAVLLGQPYHMLIPDVVGMKVVGSLPEGSTATDLVLKITEMLREKGVVGKFVEFFGPGLVSLTLPDRATISNMSPEYGATMTFFPVDVETLRYLTATGRPPELVELVRSYTAEQNLFHSGNTAEPEYSAVYEVNLDDIKPSLAGPRKPHERIDLGDMKRSFLDLLPDILTAGVESDVDDYQDTGCWADEGGSSAMTPESCASPAEPRGVYRCVDFDLDVEKVTISDGSVVIAAITSCTNTSNPSVMIGAGLLARNAVERGLHPKPWVKTSMAPGSRVVTDYLDRAGLMPSLEALGFHVVGYGCTTCIGNSGPLAEPITKAIEDNQLITAAVLSGNRNYEARINPHVRANYLASPVLVVAYALAGSVNVDLVNEPVSHDPNGDPVYLREIWPSKKEIDEAISSSLDPEMFRTDYANVFSGDDSWKTLSVPEGGLYAWDPDSTYIQEPPFFRDMPENPSPLTDVAGAKILGIFGDTLTTDHISPAGAIPEDSPAGRYLTGLGIDKADFNSFGSRRGNHEVLLRGTFGNIRIRNLMVDREGGWTLHMPDGELMTIYEAAMKYRHQNVPLVVIGGREYGAGSSRDWAAKGTLLLGVRAVIAESYERIHRGNLVGMGVLPLQFEPGAGAGSLGLTGRETLDIEGIEEIKPEGTVTVTVHRDGGETDTFTVKARLDSEIELEYYRHGGILQYVLRGMLGG